jgi:hypothetical protein
LESVGESLGVALFLITPPEGSKLYYEAIKAIGVLKAKAEIN